MNLPEDSKIVVFNDRIVTGGGTPPLPWQLYPTGHSGRLGAYLLLSR